MIHHNHCKFNISNFIKIVQQWKIPTVKGVQPPRCSSLLFLLNQMSKLYLQAFVHYSLGIDDVLVPVIELFQDLVLHLYIFFFHFSFFNPFQQVCYEIFIFTFPICQNTTFCCNTFSMILSFYSQIYIIHFGFIFYLSFKPVV